MTVSINLVLWPHNRQKSSRVILHLTAFYSVSHYIESLFNAVFNFFFNLKSQSLFINVTDVTAAILVMMNRLYNSTSISYQGKGYWFVTIAEDIRYTVRSPNKGTQIRDFFPYLGQNWEIYKIRECQHFPYFVKKWPISLKMRRFSGLFWTKPEIFSSFKFQKWKISLLWIQRTIFLTI